jgi:hypothetical protein
VVSDVNVRGRIQNWSRAYVNKILLTLTSILAEHTDSKFTLQENRQFGKLEGTCAGEELSEATCGLQ